MASLAQAIAQFMALGAEAHVMQHACLETAGKMFVEKAKAAIGTYEYGWPPLAESTVARKAGGDTPLLETGALRDSFSYEVRSDHVSIGSDDPKIIYSEWGTKHEPPRPIIGGTIDHHGQEIANRMGVMFGMTIEEALAIGSVATAARNILGGMFR
jgi:HK97 gp10 family phage protein